VATSAPELPRPLTEHGTRRALGGEVIEHQVAAGDAIVGRRIGELALPAFAGVALVVRGREAIPPPASWRVAAGDVLHLVAREEVVGEVLAASERWRGAPSALVVAPWTPADGDPADPAAVLGVAVGERLMARADRAGALFALADGRLAVTGPAIAAGPRDELARYARRRIRTAADRAEGEWWRAVAVRLEPATPTRRPGSARSGRRPPSRPSG
jgi:TrkA-C domain